MDDTLRWVVGLIIALALVLLLVFARGEPDGGRGDPSSPATVVDVRA